MIFRIQRIQFYFCCLVISSATGFVFSLCGSCSTIVVNQLFSVFAASAITDFVLCFSLFSGLCISVTYAYCLLSKGLCFCLHYQFLTYFLLPFFFRCPKKADLIGSVYHGCSCWVACLGPPHKQLVGLESSNPKIKHLLCLVSSVQNGSFTLPSFTLL